MFKRKIQNLLWLEIPQKDIHCMLQSFCIGFNAYSLQYSIIFLKSKYYSWIEVLQL